MGNFQPSRTIVSGEQVSSFATANATGGGFDGAAGVTMYVEKRNGEIITTILVDIEGLVVSGTVRDIIGENDTAAAHITQITTAVNGIVYKVEMGCIEVPAGSNTTLDIDLARHDSSRAEDQTASSSTIIAPGGNWAANTWRTSTAGTNLNLVNDYLYLANGSGANTGGTYTAGKFIIKLYGASF